MARVKRGTTSLKTRKNVLKRVKGYRFGRSTKERQAREAIAHAGNHAFAHRRRKKGDFRRLWTVKLNAALRPLEMTYSKFIDALTKKNITLNRKVLSELAHNEPETFKRIVEVVK
ncbi:50S ribosomal protein L20 [Candidatus Kaiserbacteria bacterium]|nr:MAG: 50S ribosomal protein L20 [Candidatus Kaiserbacteria bacterium]